MDAIMETFKLMNRAIDSREGVKQSILTQAEGRCWSCALFVECQHAIGVDDMDTCEQWRGER